MRRPRKCCTDPEQLKRTLGRNVARRRDELAISRAECGKRAGLSQSAIGAIERGERQPLVSALMMIAVALEWTPGDILDDVRVEDRSRR